MLGRSAWSSMKLGRASRGNTSGILGLPSREQQPLESVLRGRRTRRRLLEEHEAHAAA